MPKPPPRWLAPVLLVLAAVAAYAPVVRNGFIWDDATHLAGSALNTAPDGLARIWTTTQAAQWYPLTYTLFRAEHALWGFDPRGYHLLNLLLHVLSALLLARVFLRLKVPGAWWAAALFAVHPVNVQAVAWATELKDVLCMVFAAAATERWLAYREEGRERDYALALLAYAACLLSKTAACLLPAVFAALEWEKGRALGRRLALRLAPFFVLGGALSVVTILYERLKNGADPVYVLPWLQRVLLAGRVPWFYAWKLALPFGLSFVYPRWSLDAGAAVQWLPLAALLGAAALLWAERRRWGRAPAAAAASFLLLLFPVLGLFSVFYFRFSFVADHFAYFASAAALALVPAAVERVLRAPAARRAVLAGLTLLLASLAWARVRTFRDPITVWTDVLEKNPGAWLAWDDRAAEELSAGRFAEAESDAARAVALSPNFGVGWFHLAVARWNQGKRDEAAKAFARSADVAPGYRGGSALRVALCETYLGVWESQRGRKDAAAERFQRAAEFAPEQPESWFNLGRALSEARRPGQAVDACRKGLAMSPDAPAGAPCRALVRRAARTR